MRKFYFNFQMFDDTTITPALTKKAFGKQLWKEAKVENFLAGLRVQALMLLLKRKPT